VKSKIKIKTPLVMPLLFPCDSVLVILSFLVIHGGSLPPIFLDSLRDFYFRVMTVTSIFLLEFAAKVLAP
jgi:hypothetical protein